MLPFFLASVGTVNLVTVSSSTISIQLVAGSVIVRNMKSILVHTSPLRMYGPMRSTHHALQQVVMTSSGGTWPYFWLCLLFIWQDLQNLMYDWMVLCIPFQYIMDLIVSSRREWPGACDDDQKCSWEWEKPVGNLNSRRCGAHLCASKSNAY